MGAALWLRSMAVGVVRLPRERGATLALGIHKAALGHAQLARLCPRCAAARAVPPFGMKVVLPPRLTFLFIKEFGDGKNHSMLLP